MRPANTRLQTDRASQLSLLQRGGVVMLEEAFFYVP
jgi:hypothetical protein